MEVCTSQMADYEENFKINVPNLRSFEYFIALY